MRYKTPNAFRTALEDRLGTRANETGVNIGRLRRRAVLERLLVRLDVSSPGRWVLKGGMALELRLQDRARASKDIDLVLREAEHDGAAVHELLTRCLGVDPEGDAFEFTVGAPTQLEDDDAGRPGWRFAVTASLAGRVFDALRLDVVARENEINGTERLPLPGLFAFAELPAHEVEVVDREQHFAEKLHAFTRDYGNRPSTRSKDLVDLVILMDDGLTPTRSLRETVEHVFRERSTHSVPDELPDPPAAWDAPYAAAAAELDISAPDLDTATAMLRAFWAQTTSENRSNHGDA
jgi:predicted nucleotidyltransferase component of viral defense system